MQNALLVGLSRQMVLSRQLDVIANNIANLNTTGFKADESLFEEYLMPLARDNTFVGGDRRVSYVQDRGSWRDYSVGSIERTGNALDVAIDGNAFLTVQTAQGQRYTRNGALQIDASGTLVTASGDPVTGGNGPIVFQPGDHDVNIAADGTVTVHPSNSNIDTVRGTLQLASFANPQQLQKEGANLYSAPAAAQAQPAKARLIQGAIERSNVSSVLEMTRMIDVTRTYTNIAGIIQNQGDLRKTAIDRLSQVPS
jgi:flagellar basal-body rod protein FlgF/flagellar basal-body rod protein FlgG